MRRTLFVSDLHLDASREDANGRLERFLGEVVPGADALYVLGDLFEYWVGDEALALPLPARIATAFARATASVPGFFMHGNRDFLAGGRFARATGLALLEDPAAIDLYGRRTLLLHGDTLCTDDREYQAFRAQVRDPRWQRTLLARPLEERLALAREMRAGSESAKAGKAVEIMDVAPAAVERAFAESGAELMIHGHTHRPGRHAHRVGTRDCERWVLPDWYGTGGYLEATPDALRAVTLA